MRLAVIYALILLLTSTQAATQNSIRDSLYQQAQSLEDSAKLASYSNFAAQSNSQEEILFWIEKLKAENVNADSVYWNGMILHHFATIAKYKGALPKAIRLRKRAIDKFDQTGHTIRSAKQYNNIGNAYADMAQYDSAMYFYQLFLEAGEKANDQYIVASAYMNISTIYNSKGDEKQELENLLKSIKISRENDLQDVLANCLVSLSIHYAGNMDFEKAEEVLDELQILYKATNNLYGFGLMHNIRAKLSFDQNDPETALLYLDSSMQYFQELGYTVRVASLQMNMGQVLGEMGKQDEAREQLWNAYISFNQIGDLRSSAIALHDLGTVMIAKELPKTALNYMKRAVFLCDSLGVLDLETEYTKDVAEIFSLLGMEDSAYSTLLKYDQLKYSLNKVNNKEAIELMETKYETERKELEIKNLQQEKELNEATLKSKEAQTRALYLGLGAAVVLIIFISFAFVQKRKDNQLINSQKELLVERNEELNYQKDIVEEKNREITDSINYAKRIQEAVMPPLELIKENLPKSFVLYLPKDIVAGDFYWFSSVKDSLLIAAADCTGHGVPGAMVSVVCSSALNRAVGEFGLEKPAEILDKCQELVVNDLGKSSSEIKDGMDVALCLLKKGKSKIQYAGAQNPIWIIGEKPKTAQELIEFESSKSGKKLWELKANKQSIGNTDDFQEFSNNELDLEKGSRVYLFSDGYLDQFGGGQGKKLKSKNLKELILSIQDIPIDQQGEELKREFHKWKGDLEQLDDVCIIGIEV